MLKENSTDSKQFRCLAELIEAGDVDTVKTTIDSRDFSENTWKRLPWYARAIAPLTLAVTRGHLKIIQCLIDRKLDYSVEWGDPPLITAVSCGHVQVVRTLVEKYGYDINIIDPNHYETALFRATRGKHIELVRYLIHAGADVNAVNRYNGTVVSTSVETQDLSLVKVLVEAGADVNHVYLNNQTVLIHAVEMKNIKMVKYLVESGANMHYIGEEGSIHHSCVKSGNVEICGYLLSQGISDIDARDPRGKTALFQAAIYGYERICDLLVAYGADVNRGTDDSENSFMSAARFCSLDIVKRIHAFGVDPDVENIHGERPLDVAVEFGRLSLVHYLTVTVNVRLQRHELEDSVLLAALRQRSSLIGPMVVLLLKVGCLIGRKEYTCLSKYVETLPPGEVSEYIRRMLNQPRSLADISCFCARRCFGKCLPRVVERLQLPRNLVTFVKLSYVTIVA